MYYESGGFIRPDAEPGLTPACDLWLRLASSVSRGPSALLRAEPGALQLSELNPSITQKATPGLAGEHSFVSNQAIKNRQTLITITAYSPELQEG